MSDDDHDSKIEQIAQALLKDGIAPSEQDQQKLAKYCDFAREQFQMGQEQASEIVNEALLYLMLKTAKDVDPLQQGDKFGAGFS